MTMMPSPDATPIREDALKAVDYFPDDGLVVAVNLAWTLQMPLLLTGEPGTGKTVFADAVAKVLRKAGHSEGDLLRCDVRSDSTARDLLYQHDAVARFADAQGERKDRAREPRNYIRLQGLGEALAHDGSGRRVLLVDEIDKAPRDLPNDLLRELDEGVFRIPEIQDFDDEPSAKPLPPERARLKAVMGHRSDEGRAKPLVIITSNAERQLPDPFLRRCVFHHIEFPDYERLMEIVVAKAFPPLDDDGDPQKQTQNQAERVRREETAKGAVKLFQAIRDPSRHRKKLVKKPATSELVQWVQALDVMYPALAVRARLGQVLQSVEAGEPAVDWTELPALQCLVKVRDDLTTLSPHAAGT